MVYLTRYNFKEHSVNSVDLIQFSSSSEIYWKIRIYKRGERDIIYMIVLWRIMVNRCRVIIILYLAKRESRRVNLSIISQSRLRQ